MKKTIDFIQLCILIKKEKQPKEITFRLNEEHKPIKCHWNNGQYYAPDNKPITEFWKLYGLCIGIYEYEEPILTDGEREYLSSVIKPIRKEILSIEKVSLGTYERIELNTIKVFDPTVVFPAFPKGKYYKEIECGRTYILEELGL